MDSSAALSVRELAAELRCSEDDVRALIREGELQPQWEWREYGEIDGSDDEAVAVVEAELIASRAS